MVKLIQHRKLSILSKLYENSFSNFHRINTVYLLRYTSHFLRYTCLSLLDVDKKIVEYFLFSEISKISITEILIEKYTAVPILCRKIKNFYEFLSTHRIFCIYTYMNIMMTSCSEQMFRNVRSITIDEHLIIIARTRVATASKGFYQTVLPCVQV